MEDGDTGGPKLSVHPHSIRMLVWAEGQGLVTVQHVSAACDPRSLDLPQTSFSAGTLLSQWWHIKGKVRAGLSMQRPPITCRGTLSGEEMSSNWGGGRLRASGQDPAPGVMSSILCHQAQLHQAIHYWPLPGVVFSPNALIHSHSKRLQKRGRTE